jgi:cell division protein FtsX
VERKKICDKLKALPTVEQVQENAKKLTARIKEMRRACRQMGGRVVALSVFVLSRDLLGANT